MGLTSLSFVGLLTAVTVILPLTLVVGVRRRAKTGSPWHWRAWRPAWGSGPRGPLSGLGRWFTIVVCQLLAVLTVLVWANRSMQFYQTWNDLFGDGKPAGQAAVNEALPARGGEAVGGGAADRSPTHISDRKPTPSGATLVTLRVHGQASGVADDVLVWLPKEYDSPQWGGKPLPVLFMMPGQPGSPKGVYDQYEFDKAASASIAGGQTKPFIGVFPPIMTHPPRDTECLDIPNGPQSETWLVQDVRQAVAGQFRTAPDPKQWNLAGYSTGGYCAANLLLRHRDQFGAAASIGGYFHPWPDSHTGDLFGGNEELRKANTPLLQFQSGTPRPTNLLIASSERDAHSWGGDGPGGSGDSRDMIDAAKRWPGTASIVLKSGGHGFKTYTAIYPQVLAWFGRVSGL